MTMEFGRLKEIWHRERDAGPRTIQVLGAMTFHGNLKGKSKRHSYSANERKFRIFSEAVWAVADSEALPRRFWMPALRPAPPPRRVVPARTAGFGNESVPPPLPPLLASRNPSSTEASPRFRSRFCGPGSRDTAGDNRAAGLLPTLSARPHQHPAPRGKGSSPHLFPK